MKISNLQTLILLLFVSAFAFQSCKDDESNVDDPDDDHEEEVITSMIISFVDSANSANTKSFAFRDPDGEGGNGPTQFDTIKLDDSTTWNASIVLLNESESPADTISNEVKEEADEHLFCFTPTAGGLTIDITDTDGTLPLGLESKWTTVQAGNGSVKVVLKHQPGVKTGACDPGETDIEVDFPIQILN